MLFGAVSLHMLIFWGQWATDPDISWLVTFSTPKYVRGFIAWAALAAIVLTSLPPVRRMLFNVFYAVHFSFVVFFVFVYLHTPHEVQFYLIGAIVIYSIDKALQTVWGLLPRRAKDIEVLLSDVVKLRIPRDCIHAAVGLDRPGQYIFLNVPGINPLEWHPFSLTSSPTAPEYEVAIRASGNFTQALLAKARTHASSAQAMYVRVDGPYGHVPIDLHATPAAVLVLGGIGITPAVGILRAIAAGALSGPRGCRVHVVWIVRQAEHFSWFEDVLQPLVREARRPGPRLLLSVYVTRPGRAALAPPLRAGRPSLDAILANAVPAGPTWVFACGPDSMIADTWDAVVRRRRGGHAVVFHRETFAL
eukprot:m.212218 g.212218  ORF g.212218 m.212218 type:complete len:362 (-) comp10141_c5_seq1:55-1140(-)